VPVTCPSVTTGNEDGGGGGDVGVGPEVGSVTTVGVGSGESGGVASGEVDDVGVGAGVGVAVGVDVWTGVGVGVDVRTGVGVGAEMGGGTAIGAGMNAGVVGVTTSKRASAVAAGGAKRAGQASGSLSHPSSPHESRTRYAPTVPSPSRDAPSTYRCSVACTISVPGGNTSSGKWR